MPVIDESILINRTPHDVFEFATDPTKVPLYSSNLLSYEMTSEGEPGLGSTFAGDVRVAGKTFYWTSEATEFDPDHSWTTRSIESPMPWEIHVELVPENGGTRVDWHQETGGLAGFFGKLAEPLVTKMYAKDVKSNLEKMKLLLES